MRVRKLTPLVLAGVVGLAGCVDANPVAMGPGGIHTSIATVAAGDMPMMHVDGIGNAYVPGQIIVRFRPGAARSEIAKANRAKHKREMRLERTVILEVPVGEEFEIAR
ncbi:MAG TPA: hypothetical protein VFX29_04330, partial [Longimicrobiaceae bacterium]|nr:hypothetical protein [Longimicrobiaceae bacterium]